MTLLPRRLRLLASLTVLPLLAAPPYAHAAATPKAPVRAVARPVAASTAIIPLPLNPIVPAGQRVCAAKTASGLGYTMLRPAAGTKPGKGDVALVNYIGYLAATGAVFDQNTRTPLGVDGVIAGFAEGLQLLGRTGVVRLCIPAAMGYGAQGSGPIPANSDLIFQVELIDFKTAAEVESLRKATPAETPPAP